MKNPMKKLLAATVFFTVASSTFAADENTITRDDLKAVPELREAAQPMATTNSTGTSMRCLVDTPAWDSWGSPECFSVGFSRTATAYFQIDNAPSNYTVHWSDSRCISTSTSCSLPIRAYRSITLNATVLNHSNNTFTTVSATASYEGMD